MVLLGENWNSASITDPEDDSISAEEVEKRLNALICDFSNSGANPIKCLNETINKWSNELTINTWWDLIISWGFAEVIKKWTKNISIYLWTFAVFWIVYWWFSLTISAWEDEKVTKAKNILKWAIIWFLLIITTSLIINLIVNLMYSLWS
jgi:hypothetical protein